jgi:hypothetical protein
LSNIDEVSAVLVVPAVADALEVAQPVLSEDSGDLGRELSVLLHIVEGCELLEDSQEVREIAVTIRLIIRGSAVGYEWEIMELLQGISTFQEVYPECNSQVGGWLIYISLMNFKTISIEMATYT